VAKAASCLSCVEDDPRRAALLSFAPDGSDMRIVAVGLRNSFDLGWNPADGVLYIADDERPGMAAELNALRDFAGESSADFGWPYCDPTGAPVAGVSDASSTRCETATLPAITFDAESRPAGMVFYEGDAFPEYRGSLLVALSGSWNATTIAGYELVRVAFDADGQPTQVLRVLPFTTRSTSDASLIRTSFYPYRLTGLAISPEGWIYVGVAEGRIYRFRPMPGG
jgi:glucose/arabinose dehydrogenase